MQASVNCSESRILQLPPSISSSLDSVKVRSQSSFVIIGANGSGKTRFGVWIEFSSRARDLVHRIAAQKSLSIPDYFSTSSLNAATNLLRYGYHKENLNDEQTTPYKRRLTCRYTGCPEIGKSLTKCR
jgi:hypothetical protein